MRVRNGASRPFGIGSSTGPEPFGPSSPFARGRTSSGCTWVEQRRSARAFRHNGGVARRWACSADQRRVSKAAELPDPPQVVWSSLREVVGDHPSITGARFDDAQLRAEFKTDMSFATYGQNMSAAVTANEAGTTVVIEGIAKRQSVARRDSARIRKIAERDPVRPRGPTVQAAPGLEPRPAPARTAARSLGR